MRFWVILVGLMALLTAGCVSHTQPLCRPWHAISVKRLLSCPLTAAEARTVAERRASARASRQRYLLENIARDVAR